jgi:hypothetical protein
MKHIENAGILKQSRAEFWDSVTSESFKVTILSILLNSWSMQEVQEVFPCASKL